MVTNASNSAATESLTSNSDWTTAYYMSRVDKIRAILDHGQPIPIGLFNYQNIKKNAILVLISHFLSIEQSEYVNGNQKDDSGPGTELLLSSIPNPSHSTASTFVHRAGNTSYRIETAFEVRVRTQAVCVAEQTIRSSDDEPRTSNYLPVTVWTTKEAGACVLTALLLKLIAESGGTSKSSVSEN